MVELSSSQALASLQTALSDLIARAQAAEGRYASVLARSDARWRKSPENLLHYLSLREQDIRDIQRQLGQLGLSRLGRAESHVMASLLTAQSLLCRLQGKAPLAAKPPFSIEAGKQAIDQHAEALLGRRRSASRSRIMVTMPSDATEQPAWLTQLIEAGMSAARINCAKDGPDTWAAMIREIRAAAERAGRPIKIGMDLGGPKLRTGPMHDKASLRTIRPRATQAGHGPQPARIWLASEPMPELEVEAHLPVPLPWAQQLQPGDLIGVVDVNRRQVQLQVQYSGQDGAFALADKPFSVRSGASLRVLNRPVPHSETRLAELPREADFIRLHVGDHLRLTRAPIPGQRAQYDGNGQLVQPAHISCTLPEVFDHLQEGEPVLFNDGKIEGVIRQVSSEEVDVEITFAKPQGSKLRPDKGINFPQTHLQVRGLTDKDREDLRFVAQHADVVSMSFVNTPEDVHDLLDELERLGANLGIILKIETRQGFRQLPGILLAAMRAYPVGVMIARGDLAVEVGWQELALVQEEIGRICEAAHVPTIWATQVLETLAKKGRPSRAEITDAAFARRAECVMLNKGPHILEAVQMLGTILLKMEEFRAKSAPMLPELITAWPQVDARDQSAS